MPYVKTESQAAVDAHDQALAAHDQAWERMHALRLSEGTSSPAYREAREERSRAFARVVEAAKAAQASRRSVWVDRHGGSS